MKIIVTQRIEMNGKACERSVSIEPDPERDDLCREPHLNLKKIAAILQERLEVAPYSSLKQFMNTNDTHIIRDKELRRDIDAVIQQLKSAAGEGVDPWLKPRRSRERSLAVTKLQEAVMWLGMDLKAINDESGNEESPYPNSKDPGNTIIDPTADGLKL